ncbi:MAG: hypothetical protein ACE5Q6_06505 [Dehalococcoidia bacterium]
MQTIVLLTSGLLVAGMLAAGAGLNAGGWSGMTDQLWGSEALSQERFIELVQNPGEAIENSESKASLYRFIDAVGAAFSGPETDTQAPMSAPSDAEVTSLESLADQFQQAGDLIQDPETRAYYQRLMEDIHPAIANEGTTGLGGQLPDIEGISRESLIAPLQQAGAGIDDPEMKAHYQRLMREIGLEK